MHPKSINTNAIPYTMGGCIANLLFAAIGIITMLFLPLSPVMWLYTWSFTAFGIGLFLMNGLASIRRVCNDKACYDLLKSDNNTRIIHNAQLITAKYLMNGYTYKQIGEELICLCPEIAENDIEAYQAILEYYYYLDVKNHIKMGQALNKIRSKDNISKVVLDILDMEMVYIRLLCGIILHVNKKDQINQNDTIDKINSNHTYVESSFIKIGWDYIYSRSIKGDAHVCRVNTVCEAYLHLVAGHITDAVEILSESIRSMEKSNYVYEGEKKFCIRRLVEVKEIIGSSLKERKTGDILAV